MSFKSWSRGAPLFSPFRAVLACLYLAVIFTLLIGSMVVGRNIHTANDINELEIAAVVGLPAGLVVTLIALVFYRHKVKTVKKLLEVFLFSAFITGFLVMNVPSALVRYLPGETVRYDTEFSYTFPGPSKGKHGRCEMGFRIKDRSLGRWIELCSDREWLHSHLQRGMDRVTVVEKTNRYGIQLIDYQLGWSPIAKSAELGRGHFWTRPSGN